jgi:hypothetical protein
LPANCRKMIEDVLTAMGTVQGELQTHSAAFQSGTRTSRGPEISTNSSATCGNLRCCGQIKPLKPTKPIPNRGNPRDQRRQTRGDSQRRPAQLPGDSGEE